jgi:hypothetical protein
MRQSMPNFFELAQSVVVVIKIFKQKSESSIFHHTQTSGRLSKHLKEAPENSVEDESPQSHVLKLIRSIMHRSSWVGVVMTLVY